jgi:hypothetical protein
MIAAIFTLAGCDNGTNSTTPGSPSKPANNELAEKANTIAAGFGTYNGSSIEWQVLTVDTENHKALLITKDILLQKGFSENNGTATWETSQIRVWLKGDFYADTFNNEEKGILLETDVKATANADYPDVSKGNDTKDYVFLLSAQEANQYFADDTARIAKFNGENENWYLRTVGLNTESSVFVRSEGIINLAGATNFAPYGIRPAIWVDITPKDESGN